MSDDDDTIMKLEEEIDGLKQDISDLKSEIEELNKLKESLGEKNAALIDVIDDINTLSLKGMKI